MTIMGVQNSANAESDNSISKGGIEIGVSSKFRGQ